MLPTAFPSARLRAAADDVWHSPVRGRSRPSLCLSGRRPDRAGPPTGGPRAHGGHIRDLGPKTWPGRHVMRPKSAQRAAPAGSTGFKWAQSGLRRAQTGLKPGSKEPRSQVRRVWQRPRLGRRPITVLVQYRSPCSDRRGTSPHTPGVNGTGPRGELVGRRDRAQVPGDQRDARPRQGGGLCGPIRPGRHGQGPAWEN